MKHRANDRAYTRAQIAHMTGMFLPEGVVAVSISCVANGLPLRIVD